LFSFHGCVFPSFRGGRLWGGRVDHAGMVTLNHTPLLAHTHYKHLAARELAKLTGQTEII